MKKNNPFDRDNDSSRDDRRGDDRREGGRPSFGRRDDAPRGNRRDDARNSNERGGYNRRDNDGPRFGGSRGDDDRRSDRPRFGRDDNRRDNDRPRFGASREDKPRFDRPDRPRFGDDRRDDNRRNDRNRDDRPRFERDDRFNRRDNDDRRSAGPRFGGPREDKPRFDGPDRPRFGDDRRNDSRRGDDRRPFGKRDDSNFNRDDSRPRFERDNRRDNDERRPNERSFNRRDDARRSDARRDDARRDDARPRFGRDDRREDIGRFGRDNERPFRGGNDKRSSSDSRFNRRDNAPRGAEGDRREKFLEESRERRVGKYDKAPTYNLDAIREGLARKKQKQTALAKKQTAAEADGLIRLNRYIANAGICSRREADELIARGDIQVNGKVITEMGYKVQPTDVVKYGNKILNPEKIVYVLLNKPKDYITTTDDPEERKTVMELVADAGPFRIYPVGRLDRNTTGLLLLTNDGELAEKLTHPSHHIKKIYQVELDKPITEEHFEAIQAGVELEDGFIKPDDLGLVTPDAQVVGIEIHSGRNRIVRRIFEHFGYEVTKLDRTVYAGLTKKDLPRGKWRFLEPKEVVKLKYLI